MSSLHCSRQGPWLWMIVLFVGVVWVPHVGAYGDGSGDGQPGTIGPADYAPDVSTGSRFHSDQEEVLRPSAGNQSDVIATPSEIPSVPSRQPDLIPTTEPSVSTARPTPAPTSTVPPPESPAPPRPTAPQAPVTSTPIPVQPPHGDPESPTPPPGPIIPSPTLAPTLPPTPTTKSPSNASSSDGSGETIHDITASPISLVPSPSPTPSHLPPTQPPTSPPSPQPLHSPTPTKTPSPVDKAINELIPGDQEGKGHASQRESVTSNAASAGSILSILGIVFGAAAVLVLTLCVIHTRRVRKASQLHTPIP